MRLAARPDCCPASASLPPCSAATGLHEAEAQPDARGRAAGVAAVEALDDLGLLGVGDAGAAVAHDDLRFLAAFADRHRDRRTRGRVT
jgi:hypothetical protein